MVVTSLKIMKNKLYKKIKREKKRSLSTYAAPGVRRNLPRAQMIQHELSMLLEENVY